jgi:hypothetical protein
MNTAAESHFHQLVSSLVSKSQSAYESTVKTIDAGLIQQRFTAPGVRRGDETCRGRRLRPAHERPTDGSCGETMLDIWLSTIRRYFGIYDCGVRWKATENGGVG